MSTSIDDNLAAQGQVPKHVAIIMDGNNRGAKKRFMPGVAGHKAGVDAVRAVVETSAREGVEVLTLFAFSSENWRRPAKEVSALMQLFVAALQREVKKLHKNNIGIWYKKSKFQSSNFDDKKLEKIFFKNLFRIGYRYFSKTKRTKNDIFLIKAFQRRFLPKNVTGKIDQKTIKISHFLANHIKN